LIVVAGVPPVDARARAVVVPREVVDEALLPVAFDGEHRVHDEPRRAEELDQLGAGEGPEVNLLAPLAPELLVDDVRVLVRRRAVGRLGSERRALVA